MADYCYLGDGDSDGTILGHTTSSYVGFFGATPVQRQTASTALGTTAATTTTPWGFATSTQANAIATAVNLHRTALVNLGLAA